MTNKIMHKTTKKINVKTIIMAMSLMTTLMTINAYGSVFAQGSSESDDSYCLDDQSQEIPCEDCYYPHENSGVLSPCNPTPGNPPIKFD